MGAARWRGAVVISTAMKTIAAVLLAATLAACASTAPDQPSAAASESDEFRIETTVLATYNVLSGPAGRRDWDRFEALFAPGAQLVNASQAPALVETPKQYVVRATPLLNAQPWFERPVATRTLRYGDVAQVWSTYEARAAANREVPSARGIRSFELVRIGGEWKVQSVIDQREDAAHPIPAMYLGRR